jgi:hypothetical protein
VVDSDGESENTCRDCSGYSVCTHFWIDSRPSEFQAFLFDSDHRIEITDFSVMGEEVEGNEYENESDGDVGVGGFSGAEWFPKIDIEGFMSILIEISVAHPVTQSDFSDREVIFPVDVPMFVLEMISADQSPDEGTSESFNNIFGLLKENDFQILSGVDSVSFITWVEQFES